MLIPNQIILSIKKKSLAHLNMSKNTKKSMFNLWELAYLVNKKLIFKKLVAKKVMDTALNVYLKALK